jgi:hypothetical protein
MNESKSSAEQFSGSGTGQGSSSNNNLMNDYYDNILAKVKSNVLKRQQELEEDLQENVIVENRIISGTLSSIPGMQRHLSHAKNAKNLYESQQVQDIQSHANLTRKDLNRKYHKR